MALVRVIGPAVLTRSTSQVLVVTRVAPVTRAQTSAVPMVKPLASRNMTEAPAAVSEAAKVRVTVLAVRHRLTAPLATTARRSEERRVGKEGRSRSEPVASAQTE